MQFGVTNLLDLKLGSAFCVVEPNVVFKPEDPPVPNLFVVELLVVDEDSDPKLLPENELVVPAVDSIGTV